MLAYRVYLSAFLGSTLSTRYTKYGHSNLSFLGVIWASVLITLIIDFRDVPISSLSSIECPVLHRHTLDGNYLLLRLSTKVQSLSMAEDRWVSLRPHNIHRPFFDSPFPLYFHENNPVPCTSQEFWAVCFGSSSWRSMLIHGCCCQGCCVRAIFQINPDARHHVCRVLIL